MLCVVIVVIECRKVNSVKSFSRMIDKLSCTLVRTTDFANIGPSRTRGQNCLFMSKICHHNEKPSATGLFTKGSALCNDVLTPSCKRNSGPRTFHLSASCLWNNLGDTYGNIIFIKENSSQEHLRLVGLFDIYDKF